MTSKKQIEANRRNSQKSCGPTTAQGKQIARMNALKHGLRAENVVLPSEDPEEFEALSRSLQEHYQPIGSAECIQLERIVQYTWRLQRVGLIETAIMRTNHVTYELERAKEAKERAKIELDGSADDFLEQLILPPDEDYDEHLTEQSGKDESPDPVRTYTVAHRNYEKFMNAHQRASDEAETEYKSPMGLLAVAFLRSIKEMETVSRYETSTERRQRTAILELERLQTARKLEAAETGTVIDVTDLNQVKG